jgi:hypothetical protein
VIKPQQFTVLAGVTIVSALLAAIVYGSANRYSQGRIEGQALASDLRTRINTASAIEIVQGDKKLTLERSGDQWKLKDRAGYPVLAEKARALVLALSSADTVEPKTASKDRYALLDLQDPATKDAKSRGVKVLDDKGKPLADVVVGKSKAEAFGSGRPGFYVRTAASAQTWLATGDPKASVEIRDWVQTGIFSTVTDKITRLTIAHPGEAPLVIEKGTEKDQKFKLAAMPDGKKLKQGVTIDQIPQGYSSIDMEDMRKIDTTPAGDKVSVLTLESEGGLKVTFHLNKDGDSSWLSFAAAGEGDAKTQADEINAKAAGWEFKIPGWKADTIGKRAADLFETS